MSGTYEHTYERLVVDGVTYLVVGLGGVGVYSFKESPAESSRKRYKAGHGAMLVVAERGRMMFTFAAADGTPIDTHTIEKRCPGRD